MLEMEIRQQACRGCRMCVEVCPTQVLDYDEGAKAARIRELRDCIACLSCAYVCPSGAIRHTGHHVVKNFYRDLEFVSRMERFL